MTIGHHPSDDYGGHTEHLEGLPQPDEEDRRGAAVQRTPRGLRLPEGHLQEPQDPSGGRPSPGDPASTILVRT